MARLEGAYEQVSQRLTNIDLRFDALDRKIDLRFTAVDQRFDAVDQRFSALDAKIDQRFMWTVGIIVTTWLTTMGAIASIYVHH